MQEPNPFVSAALEANLETTRSEPAPLPAAHQRLLHVTEPHYGLHRRVRQFLSEYHHRFRNRELIVEQYREIVLQDLWAFTGRPDAGDLIGILLDIGGTLFDSAGSPAVRERALTTQLEMVERLCEHGGRWTPVVAAILERAETACRSDPRLHVLASGLLKRLPAQVATDSALQEQAERMLRTSLARSLDWWRAEADIERRLAAHASLFGVPPAPIAGYVGARFFDEEAARLARADHWGALLEVADFQSIAERIRQAGALLESPLERVSYLFVIVHLPSMQHLRERLLWDVNDALTGLREEPEARLLAFLDAIFAAFAALGADHWSSVLDCLLTLGREMHATGSERLVGAFIDHVVDLGFAGPGVDGVDEGWQVRYDRTHVKNIRVWLTLVELDPARWVRLLSALIIALRTRGVFLADTDLFQRDVTTLLNARIEAVYPLVKQLACLFPVYFNEIGAEGELRDTSTIVDELSHRQDLLVHFLRKQVHAESNNQHLQLVDAILRFWHDKSTAALLPLVPAGVAATLDDGPGDGVCQAVRRLCRALDLEPERLPTTALPDVEAALAAMEDIDPVARARVRHLVRLKQLLSQKYTIDPRDIVPEMQKLRHFTASRIEEFESLLAAGDTEATLAWVLDAIRGLRGVILDPRPENALEDIYYKRHIAAGIPSMYGRYLEPKFQAIGLTFRLEALASRLIERLIAGTNLAYITAPTLGRVHRLLQYFKEAMDIEGLADEAFASRLEMLRYSLTTPSFSIHQFVNLFQFIAADVKEVIGTNFLHPHEDMLPRVLRAGAARTADPALAPHRLDGLCEQFYRDLIACSFPVPLLDTFVAAVISALNEMTRHLPADVVQSTMSYEPRLTTTRFYQENAEVDNPVFLGGKGYFLKKLQRLGFPVPPGFVITTEVFRRRDAISRHPQMRAELHAIIRDRIADLERMTGTRLGAPENPLLLSVRSGAAMSIPGAMNTFLNVGLNEEIVERLSTRPNYGWTSWDCYRRFLQSWGMAAGVERDAFDRVMMQFKEEHGVAQKIQFTAGQMRDMALTYRRAISERGLRIENEPFAQVIQAILGVLDSWHTERARVYRSKLQVAEEWGTAVVVQQMVLGNLNDDSGTGVLFTHDPFVRDRSVSPYGDFTICSQGEDIVGGLVHVLPISERQRLRARTPLELSLEKDFPEIYARLFQLARALVVDHGFRHQEIEFTFESSRAEDLYILQTRDQPLAHEPKIAVFDVEAATVVPAGAGLGVGGGAMNGLVCFDASDIERVRAASPDARRILVRPDTVPDDIGMIFECDGLLTARGGAASHAAVTAVRLGKTCVVDCRELVVDDRKKACTLGGVRFVPGDAIALDGRLGYIYAGHHPICYETLQMPS